MFNKTFMNKIFSKEKCGFTLAEVLITLGIIGVVAVMTIPTLLANIRGNQYRSSFKKAISILSQTARMSQAQYGFDYSGIDTTCGANASTENPEQVHSICALMNGTLSGATYFANATDIAVTKNNKTEPYSYQKGPFFSKFENRDVSYFRAYTLRDGTIIGIYKSLGRNSCSMTVGTEMSDAPDDEMAFCVGFIDVNGVNPPNKEVSCSRGSDSLSQKTCIVKNDAQHMADVFPIRFHDGVVEPASAAGRYILRTAK